ncbi:tRNA 5-methylaminomethyl-2-thiouridine biosynthesis bifunctional protein MnmC [Planktothrix tepida]|uniref:MnmC-like methyltransferase domain-containing protein n=2 Tax=Planktothrix TaxID=54304 RepID=A0A1J1LKH1_9CYAN|nr:MULTISPECIES: MnmC family methyltransferase [Planktothrix]CAD5943143.1 tRNA 5-methylaminomethyl-2-thiouridine biosynthesis bifunctional protein MnmC [Planktothrix tepida]CAD5968249.1 tRNA 5-methylaminomethyl-2-thiouridine biosynthesis bifunctional protein MnmC [Planktothrix pseudagardhii]CUR32979.1 conserved hypothetical protein [Planktothrix tepida PCC 9214]
MIENRGLIPQLTADGSFTFFSSEFGELFHSHFGAKQEAEHKFVEPLQLRKKAQKSSLFLLDICYGLGYNTAAALTAIWDINPNCKIEWIGLEFDPRIPPATLEFNLLNDYPNYIQEILKELAQNYYLKTELLNAELRIADARNTIQTVHHSGFKADAIFLDPFSPPHCPQLWTVEFLTLVGQCLKPQGQLATYSCSAAVRRALLDAGLNIGSTSPVGRRTPGTIASFEGLPPLSLQEQEHLQTRAAIPYRDPSLSDTAEVIILRRQAEQDISPLEPTSHWKKRWRNQSIL